MGKRANGVLRQEVLDLHKKGWTTDEIAGELDVSYANVASTLFRLRREGHPVDKMSRSWIALSVDEREQLNQYAASYDIPPSKLARAIITHALDEGLVAVILGCDPAKLSTTTPPEAP